jgi:hypothetical protein
MIMNSKISKLAAIILSLIFLAGCSAGSMSAEDLAARETESDATLWDEEDYKTIAAKSCIKYKVVSDKSLGEWYADWSTLGREYIIVGITSGALDDHPKWNPIANTVLKLTANALSRATGGDGVTVPSDDAIASYNLCKELGVDLNE